MHNRTKELLRFFGVGETELGAMDLPPIGPDIPPTGATLFGGVGGGKTFRMAHIAGNIIEPRVLSSKDPDNALMPGGFLRWVNWPEESEVLKRRISHGWHDDAADRVEDLRDCRTLFLDDLGQERIKGEDDWSLGAVREILDRRYRSGLDTFITTNLPADKLSSIYGARIVSRMLDAWPMIQFSGGNLRNRFMA